MPALIFSHSRRLAILLPALLVIALSSPVAQAEGPESVGSVTLTATPSSTAYGSPVTLVATVEDQNGNALGNGAVTFFDGAVRLGTVQVVSTTSAGGVMGTATLTAILAPLGSNSITATYAGASASGAAAPVSVTVTSQYPAIAALTASGSAGDYSLTATVLGAGPVNPSGSVLFNDSTTGLEIGTATFNPATLAQTFAAAAATGVTAPLAAALADINGDGIPDLVSGSAAGFFVQLGNGNGSFRAPVQISSSGVSSAATFGLLPGSSIVFGDFNGDGKTDIAFVACAGSSCAMGVLLGNGDGTFQAERDYDQGGTIAALAAGDFNGDGILDIAVANYGNGTVDILLGNGDGTFQAPLSTSMPGASSLAAADLNGDGKLDLAVSNWGANTVSVLEGNGDGTFLMAQPLATGTNPSNVSLADLRGIGILDIVNLDSNDAVSVLLGNGNGSFQPATPVLTASSSQSLANLAVADINGDGKSDLVVSDQAGNAVVVLGGNGDGTFESPASYSTGAAPLGVALADVNHDGRPDIAVASQTSNAISILLNQVTQTAALTNTAIPGKGTHSVSAAYPGDANFSAANANSLLLAAALATPTMSLAGLPSATLAWGQALSLSVTLAGPSSTLPAPTGTASYSIDKGVVVKAALSAGSVIIPICQLSIAAHSISVTYSGDSYYAALPAQTLAVTVTQATPAITWSAPAAIPYGKALNGVQLNATAKTTGTFVYSPAPGTVLTAGSKILSVAFTPNSPVYTPATASVTLTVNPATPPVSWVAPAAIPYGTALGATQLNASSPVAGTFAYTPAAGTILTAGSQTLSVSFTPTDETDYSPATATVKLTVGVAKPAIGWATPAPIAYGTALSATQLDAGSPVAGTFVYTPAAGAVLTAGAHTLSVTFTPNDTTDYTTAASSVKQLVGPEIITPPSSVTVIFGHPATFTVGATGAWPLIYQWQYLNGSTWMRFGAGTGYNSATLTTFPTTAVFSGVQLRVVITDANGVAVASSAATLTVSPAVLTQPAPQTVAIGSSATFSVVVGGVPSLTYQWQYLNGSTWMPFGAGSGYSTATLTTFPTTAIYNAVQLRVVVTDGNGMTVTSNPAKLMVGPAITTQPVSQTVNYGSAAIFTVAACSANTLAYRWQYWDGSEWQTYVAGTGYVRATLTTPALTAADNGLQLRMMVTDGDNLTATSNTVTLTVAPTIQKQPAHALVPVDWPATFTVAVSGVPNLTYQWQYLSGTTWTPFTTGTGYNTPTFTTVNNPLANNGTQMNVVITDGQGLTVTSKTVTLSVIL